jgi:FkbM family methyltransferase
LSIRSRFSKRIRGLIHLTGRELVHPSEVYYFEPHRRSLLDLLKIDLVLDVGANIGQTGLELREQGYRGRIVSFEPLGKAFAKLKEHATKDPQWQAVNCGLGERAETATINVSGADWSSSLLPMTHRNESWDPGSAYVGSEVVTIRRLDDVLGEYAAGHHSIFLKVDTQGYELAVLRGAPESLKKIALVQLELSFVELYGGQPKFYDIMRAMDDAGFDTVGIVPAALERPTQRYLQADGLFVRRKEPVSGA